MKDTSGPAFPQHQCELCTDPVGHMEPKYKGLTIRQHFAAMAMPGLLAGNIRGGADEFARLSVTMADALLTELDKE